MCVTEPAETFISASLGSSPQYWFNSPYWLDDLGPITSSREPLSLHLCSEMKAMIVNTGFLMDDRYHSYFTLISTHYIQLLML